MPHHKIYSCNCKEKYCYLLESSCKKCRLKKLSEVQNKPGPTQKYNSESAMANSIRRRVLGLRRNQNSGAPKNKLKQGFRFGPLFGTTKKPSVYNCNACGKKNTKNSNNNVYYSNGGTGEDITFWKRIMGGTRNIFPTDKNCEWCVEP